MWGDTGRQLYEIRANQALILRLLMRSLNREGNLMATLQEILDKQAKALKVATDALTLDGAIKVVMDANTMRLTDLQAQLDALISAGNTTPAQLQTLSDNMDAIIAAQDTDAAAKAILAGTPPGTGDL